MTTKTSRKNDLDLAFYEYDMVVTNINQTSLFGYESQLEFYNSRVKNTNRIEGHKQKVMWQTDFLEETYKDFLQNQRSIPQTLKKLKKWRKDLLENYKDEIDWESLIFSADPDNLQEIIDLHSDKWSDELYWETIAHCYISSNLGHSESSVITQYLNANRPNRHFLMDEDERKYLDELPEYITIYRGCSKMEIESNELRFSWTLKRETAKFFAFDYLKNISVECDIIEKTIKKSEVVAYFAGRNESEIIYFPNN